jgi:hypothetical protein
MRPEVTERRIQAFRDRFGEAHFILAMHAAFPLALTPDLLYRLWANFQQDIYGNPLNIPWLAVADLLLSGLCEEVGHELYEMPKAVRNNLLTELQSDSRFSSERINVLSDFLLVHIKQQLTSPDPDERDVAQAQRWTALAFIRPHEAAHELEMKLSELTLDNREEWIHIVSLIETLVEPLIEFEPLLIYSRAMKNLVYGNKEGKNLEETSLAQLKRQWKSVGNRPQNLEQEVIVTKPQLLSIRSISGFEVKPEQRPPVSRLIKKSPVIEQFGSKQQEIVIDWLESRQLRIAPPPPPIQHVDDHYNRLALYLGDHYAVLKDFHAAMKRAMHQADDSQRNIFEFVFRNDLDFRIGTKFCAELQRAFLAEGDFRPRPGRKFLKGKVAEDAVLRGFLDGKWLERFVYQKMAQTLTEKGLDHACLLNAKILAPLTGKTEAELDMVFLIEGQPICIECKSGQYKQEDARKFAQYAEKLNLAKPCAIFVVLEDYAADIELQKPRMETITMTASAQLVAALEAALQSMEAPLAETSEELDTVAEAKVESETAVKVLHQVKSKFRPITPQRAAVWQNLAALFSSDRPRENLNFVTLKSLLAERVGISRNQINGALLLLRNAGYFWDEQHNPVMGVGQPIYTLRSLKPEDAEQVFVEEYVKQLLKIDWSFFDDEVQCQQFATTVGTAVPGATTLERLKQELCEAERNAELTL